MNPTPTNREERQPFSFTFHTELGNSEISFQFDFLQHPIIPGRINAITGPSGSGKTTVLRNLSFATRQEPTTSYFEEPLPSFANTVTFSADALDPLPQQAGNRRLTLEQEIENYLSFMTQIVQYQHMQNALQPLIQHPAFINANCNPIEPGNTVPNDWPTPHKIACSIVTLVEGGLPNPDSIAILDEPETLIDPSLQAALMTAIQLALEATDSYAVIATNSPTILQEIHSSQVHVLRRTGGITQVGRPPIETYGETADLILNHVLSVNSDQQRYTSVLRNLALSMTPTELDAIFPEGLSSQARALITQMQSVNRDITD